MNIRTKIPFGFGLMILLVAGVSAISWISTAKMQTAQEIALELQNINEDVLNTDSLFEEFRLNITESHETDVMTQLQELISEINEMKADPTFSEKHETLKAIETELNNFQTVFKDYAKKAYQTKELNQQNSQSSLEFRKEAETAAQKAAKKAAGLGKLIERVDEKLDAAAKGSDIEKLPSLVAAAQRMRDKVKQAEEAELVANQLLNQITLMENAQLEYTITMDPEAQNQVASYAKQIFINALKLKKLDPKGSADSVKAMLGKVSSIRKSFSTIVTLNEEGEAALNTIETSVQTVDQLVQKTVELAKQNMENASSTSHSLVITALLLAIGIGLFISITMTRAIVKPIDLVINCMESLGKGDYSTKVEHEGRKDEIGRMLQQAEIFRQNGIEMEKLRKEQEQAEVLAEEQRRAAMHQTADTFEAEVQVIVRSVHEASEHLQTLATGMLNAAQQVGSAAEGASNASDEISQNVDQVAAASEELSSSVDEISRQVSHAHEASSNAGDLSTKATQDVTSLSERVGEISEVVGLITTIANQTNLLALNATIEAARAGEAGKGFAVVASEVKNLASQTAKATDQIGAQINAVVGATDNTVKGFAEINAAISDIQETSTVIASAIEEQGAATREIASSAATTAQNVTLVSSTVSKVKDGAKSNEGRAKELLTSSEDLQNQAEALRKQLRGFLDKLRSS